MMPNVNTGMPAGYVNPYQQAMAQAMAQFMPQPQMMQPQQAAQPTTPPMIHADMIEAKSEEWARQFNVTPGQTQLFYLPDESAIFSKTAHQDGGFDFDVYLRQEPKPAPEYMTREQVEALIRGMQAQKEEP